MWHCSNQGLAWEIGCLDTQAVTECLSIGLKKGSLHLQFSFSCQISPIFPLSVLCSWDALPLPVPKIPVSLSQPQSIPPPPLRPRAGVVRGLPGSQLQLLLVSYKHLHLFIAKTPLRFPGSSANGAGELSKETCLQNAPRTST